VLGNDNAAIGLLHASDTKDVHGMILMSSICSPSSELAELEHSLVCEGTFLVRVASLPMISLHDVSLQN